MLVFVCKESAPYRAQKLMYSVNVFENYWKIVFRQNNHVISNFIYEFCCYFVLTVCLFDCQTRQIIIILSLVDSEQNKISSAKQQQDLIYFSLFQMLRKWYFYIKYCERNGHLVSVVQRLVSAIQQIKHYSLEKYYQSLLSCLIKDSVIKPLNNKDPGVCDKILTDHKMSWHKEQFACYLNVPDPDHLQNVTLNDVKVDSCTSSNLFSWFTVLFWTQYL